MTIVYARTQIVVAYLRRARNDPTPQPKSMIRGALDAELKTDRVADKYIEYGFCLIFGPKLVQLTRYLAYWFA